MKINAPSSKFESIYHYTLGLLGIPETDTTTLGVNEFIRSANIWQRDVGHWAWINSNHWQYDDSNKTTLPTAVTDLEEDESTYRLESTVFDILRVEAKDVNGNYQVVLPIKETQISSAKSEFYKTSGMPRYYELVGDVLTLYPAPSSSQANTETSGEGLKIYISRDPDDFTITDTNTVPGFPSQFHNIIGMGAAHDFALRMGIDNKWQQLTLLINSKRKEIEEYYSRRHKGMPQRIIPSSRSAI